MIYPDGANNATCVKLKGTSYDLQLEPSAASAAVGLQDLYAPITFLQLLGAHMFDPLPVSRHMVVCAPFWGHHFH